ncbi:MAG TPA: alpha/beta hydrolase [Roseiflexaceae bacterium]|nr:alpha/beta hydrolase [Roseiflexaceae bacterium]
MPHVSEIEPAVCHANGIDYLVAGCGPAHVLLLHGWASSKESWRSTMLALAPYARVLAPDLPGHGAVALRGPAEMARLAAAAAGLCALEGMPDVAVVGHSMGGNVAVELALQFPQLVHRMVLVNPALQGSQMPIYTRSYLHRAHGWTILRAAMIVARRLDKLADRVPPVIGPRVVRPLRRYSRFARHDPEALRRLLAGLLANTLLDRLPQVRVPTTIIAGRFDPLVPLALSRRIAAALPNAELRIMPRAGHDPMYEQPAAFVRLLLDVLGYATTT